MWLFETTLQRKGRNAVQQFIGKHQDQIAGVLSGFDRLVLRGTLRSIAYGQGMSQYLWASQVLLKDFGSHVDVSCAATSSRALRERCRCRACRSDGSWTPRIPPPCSPAVMPGPRRSAPCELTTLVPRFRTSCSASESRPSRTRTRCSPNHDKYDTRVA